jgi:Ca2+-binding RTX toxin-like protein
VTATLTGSAGDDTLTGTNRADTIVAGGGSDTLTGGDGDDIFAINDSRAVITDFEAGNDTVDLTDFEDSSAYLDAGSIATFLQGNGFADAEAADVSVIQAGALADAAVFEFGGEVHIVAAETTDGPSFVTLSGITEANVDALGGGAADLIA